MEDTNENKNSDFIVYLEEDGTIKSLYVEIIEIATSFVKFKTYGNTYITIPFHRVLKIKQKVGDSQ